MDGLIRLLEIIVSVVAVGVVVALVVYFLGLLGEVTATVRRYGRAAVRGGAVGVGIGVVGTAGWAITGSLWLVPVLVLLASATGIAVGQQRPGAVAR